MPPPDLYTMKVSYDGAVLTPLVSYYAPVPRIGGGFFPVPQTSVGVIGLAVTAVGMNKPSWAVFAGITSYDDGTDTGTTTFSSFFSLVYRLPALPSGLNDNNFFNQGGGPGQFGWEDFNVPAILLAAPGENGTAYLAGGTLSIAKDFTANTITMTCPLGTVTRTLDENDYTDGLTGNLVTGRLPSELVPLALGMENNYSPLPPKTATQHTARFYNLQGDFNGVTYFFNALSATDPGVWDWPPLGNPGQVFAGAPETPWDNFTSTRLSTRWKIEDIYTALTDPADFTHQYVRTLSGESYIVPGLDMDYSKEHGVVFRAFTLPMDSVDVFLERSFDNGHSWEGFTVSTDMAANVNSPTVTWYHGTLYTTWGDGGAVKEARSLDGGKTWGMPTTLPFAGTNPRRVIDRHGGGAFYFVFQSGGLQCFFSYDNNATFDGPFLVVASPPAIAQQVDAEFVPNGSLLVSIFIAGVLTQYRSTDLGRTWS